MNIAPIMKGIAAIIKIITHFLTTLLTGSKSDVIMKLKNRTVPITLHSTVKVIKKQRMLSNLVIQ